MPIHSAFMFLLLYSLHTNLCTHTKSSNHILLIFKDLSISVQRFCLMLSALIVAIKTSHINIACKQSSHICPHLKRQAQQVKNQYRAPISVDTRKNSFFVLLWKMVLCNKFSRSLNGTPHNFHLIDVHSNWIVVSVSQLSGTTKYQFNVHRQITKNFRISMNWIWMSVFVCACMRMRALAKRTTA